MHIKFFWHHPGIVGYQWFYLSSWSQTSTCIIAQVCFCLWWIFCFKQNHLLFSIQMEKFKPKNWNSKLQLATSIFPTVASTYRDMFTHWMFHDNSNTSSFWLYCHQEKSPCLSSLPRRKWFVSLSWQMYCWIFWKEMPLLRMLMLTNWIPRSAFATLWSF